MKKIWKMGVLGLGEGRSILSALLSSDRWEVGNMCDLNEELCKERCREFGLDRYTLRYEDMLSDPQIDVIGIYTPDQLHAKHIMMALEAGKHVLCTKPLMIGLEEANDLLHAQERSGKAVFVGQSSRYFESAMRQRADYEAGKHGELVTLETQYISDSRWFLERGWSHQKGFSWQYNFIIHAVDLATWYLPDVEDVYGVGVVSANTRAYNLDTPDTMKFILKSRSGICASVTGVYATPSLGRGFEQSISCTLRGTEGISRSGTNLEYIRKFKQDGGTTERDDFESMRPYYYRFEGDTHHAGEYQNYIQDFAAKMDRGETPKPDVREGIRTLAVMEAMKESMQTGQVVKVSEILASRGIRL